MSLTSLKAALKPVVKQALISGGAALGSATGLPYGGQIGGALGAHLSRYIGSGDYVMNDLLRGAYPASRVTAKYKQLGVGCIRIQHTEFIGEVVAPTAAFNITNYRVNAGDAVTFPWLSNLAVSFERFKVLGMIVEYRPQASQYGNGNNALGKVMIAAEYNVNSANFSSTRAMENSNECIVFRPCDVAAYGLECADLPYDQYFVRRPGTAAPDPILYDMCNIVVATNTPITGSSLGDLFVTYDIVLDRPHLVDVSGEPAYIHFQSFNMQSGWNAGYYPVWGIKSQRLYTGYSGPAPSNGVLEYHLTAFTQYDIVQIAFTFSLDTATALQKYALGIVSGGTLIIGFDENTQGRMAAPDTTSGATNSNLMAIMTCQITADPGSSDFIFSITTTNGAPGNLGDSDVYVTKLFNPGSVFTGVI